MEKRDSVLTGSYFLFPSSPISGDIDFLNRALREEFVRIYSEPVLQNFLNEQREAHPDVDLPELPQAGNLDIRQVISSPYFFA